MHINRKDMNKVIKDKWVEALRSGEYEQTVETLKNGDGFCCLGVLCDIYHKETGKGDWRIDDVWIGEESTNTNVPTFDVVNWADIPDQNPVVGGRPVAVLNDGGKSFKEMADLIEEYL